MENNFLNWFRWRQGKVTYSMTNRWGANSYDCSSSIYYALKEAGIFPQNLPIGNTETLFNDLPKYGFTKVAEGENVDYDAKAGDIFIWGRRGHTLGAGGHTGVLTSDHTMIHCNYGFNGITENDYNYIWNYNNRPYETFYRYTGKKQDKYVQLPDFYVASEIQGDKLRCDALAPINFTWEDNGIPISVTQKVDASGEYLGEGNIQQGDRFIIPFKYKVWEEMQDGGKLWYKIAPENKEFWIVAEKTMEVNENATGTNPKSPKPAEITQVNEVKKDDEAILEPKSDVEALTPIETVNALNGEKTETEKVVKGEILSETVEKPEEKITQNGKEREMITKGQIEELKIATERMMAENDFEPIVSVKTKTIAYFATDILALATQFILTAMAILGMVDGSVAILLASAVMSLCLGLKHTFRISSKKG